MLLYYNSIDNLPIGRFMKISETGSLLHLLRDENSKVALPILEATYDKIITEYRDATQKMGKNSQLLGVQKQILVLKMKHDIIMMACSNLDVMCADNDSEAILAKYGYKIDDNRSITEQLHEIAHKSSNLKTQWLTKEAELSKLSQNEDTQSTFEQYVERISDKKGYYIDPETTTVRRWLAIEQNLIEDERNKSKVNG